ncbi:unnamed protein product [Closterium sp. Naga37s-1]|nr:unnamed protein product [Closterium sp. Naga37s-1]
MDVATATNLHTPLGAAAWGAAPALMAQQYELEVVGVPTYGGAYTRYDICGHIFEVSAKYVKPIRPIGRGAYGIVCSAVDIETEEEVAIKKISNAFDNRIDAKRTLREIKLLRHFDHENVVALRDVIPPPDRSSFNDVYVVYELMDTDLHQIIQSGQILSEEHCQYFLYQLLRGLKYIHSASVLHRDLKPSNLLLSANCDLKICDFGLARSVQEAHFLTEYVVTRWYRAPELLLNCQTYTAAIDVWSVGCIFMELLNREPLFPGKDYVEQLRLITKSLGSPDESDIEFLQSDNARRYIRSLPFYPKQPLAQRYPHLPPVAIDLMSRMLTFDPLKRITDTLRLLPFYPKLPLAQRYPHLPPGVIDRMSGMLTFDPLERIPGESGRAGLLRHMCVREALSHSLPLTISRLPSFPIALLPVEEALCHPYLTALHNINDEPACNEPLPSTKPPSPLPQIPIPSVEEALCHPHLATLHGINDEPALEEALCHPYLATLHDINDEPACDEPFHFLQFFHASFPAFPATPPVEEALCHPYLATLHGSNDEPTCD